MKTIKTKWIFAFLGGAAAIGLCFYFFLPRGSEETFYAQKVEKLIGRSDNINRFSGIIEPKSEEKYTIDPSKKITEIYVKDGQKVNEGDILFSYDASSATNSISSNNLDIEELQQNIGALNNEINALKQQLNVSDADQKYQIDQQISDKSLELRQREYDIQTKTNENAQLQQEVDRSQIKTAISGFVKIEDAGQQGDENAGQVITIVQSDHFMVKGSLDETAFNSLKAEDPVIVRSKLDQQQFWFGKVTEIKEKQEAANEGNGNTEKASRYPFYVSLEANPSLILGQHVYVEPDLGQENTFKGIWLESSYIKNIKAERPYVWKYDHGKATKKNIKIGQINKKLNMVEILEGIKKENYIIWPDKKIKEGSFTILEE